MKQDYPQPSQIIKIFLDFMENAKTQYAMALESMKTEDRVTQDHLHRLELENLNYRERSKIATQLVANRRTRRQHKDAVEELEPIVTFCEDPQNRALLNRLTQLLGQVRKAENYHQNRVYMPKETPGDIIKTVDVPEWVMELC